MPSHNPDLVTFTKEILNGKLHFLSSGSCLQFVNIKINENKYFSDVMNKYFNIELVMAKKDDKDFENSTKFWIKNSTKLLIMIKLMVMLK